MVSFSLALLSDPSRSSTVCQRKEGERGGERKRERGRGPTLPLFSLPQDQALSSRPRLCPHQPSGGDSSSQVSPKHTGGRTTLPQMPGDLVGPSLFLSRLRCSQRWPLILVQKSRRPPASQHPRVSTLQPLTVSSFIVNFLLKETSIPEPLRERGFEKRKLIIVSPALVSAEFFSSRFMYLLIILHA